MPPGAPSLRRPEVGQTPVGGRMAITGTGLGSEPASKTKVHFLCDIIPGILNMDLYFSRICAFHVAATN